jgi:hypothetical protein
MDQRGVVEELDAGREVDGLVSGDAEGLTGVEGQPGTHPLATGLEVIAGGAQGGRLSGGSRGHCRDPDKLDHQPFDREESGVGGGAHREGRETEG